MQAMPESLIPSHRLVQQFLAEPSGQLYGILDAARSERILPMLEKSKLRYQSLFSGTQGEALREVAPHLVQIPKSSPFLAQVLQPGWGEHWGIFLFSGHSFDAVRQHLRRWLLVAVPKAGTHFFRFYDPRVLRDFLPTCTEAQCRAFFGPCTLFVMESSEPDQLLAFSWREDVVEAD